jgi:hypothetical protein
MPQDTETREDTEVEGQNSFQIAEELEEHEG